MISSVNFENVRRVLAQIRKKYPMLNTNIFLFLKHEIVKLIGSSDKLITFHIFIQPFGHFPKHVHHRFAGAIAMTFVWQNGEAYRFA